MADKVYLAARYQEHPRMRQWRKFLESSGFTVTSRWINGNHSIDVDVERDVQSARFALEDLEDLDAADVMVLWNPPEHHGSGRGGRHVELGYALALGKPVMLIGIRENVFHWHKGVRVADSLTDAIDVLRAGL
jgi:nucleoside 2-deoxyribosyltransferase